MTEEKTIEKARPSKSELFDMIAENYLYERYGITLNELDEFYGLKVCKFMTRIREYDFGFVDAFGSQTVQAVTIEMNNQAIYNFDDLNFSPDDVVIDIGANVGIVSTYLARRFPFIKIYAYEPVKLNFDNLNRNLALNNVPQGIVTTERYAVNGTGEPVSIASCIGNSGGARALDCARDRFIQKGVDKDIPGITLQQIIEKHGIKKVKLLKIDCEGAEYDILKNCPPETLSMIENIRGEFHGYFDKGGEKEIKKLVKHCKKYVPNVDIIETDFPD